MSNQSFEATDISVIPYQDQKPGTSGLRKKVKIFQQDNYTSNFIQSIVNAICSLNKVQSENINLIVGGDGRYYSQECLNIILNVCCANNVQRLIFTKDGLLSTPAASALIRSRKATAGILLTASHNPGGPNEDFGIKVNMGNGGPANETWTNQVYEISKTIQSYKSLSPKPTIDLTSIRAFKVHNTDIEVIDPVENYLKLVKECFDFELLRSLFKDNSQPFKMLIDCMHGVMGPYAKKIFVDELEAPESSLLNATPRDDFGGSGHHPDPNLTYAYELVAKLRKDKTIDLGAAFDGDGDRHMILGPEAFFVTPGDSLALVGAYTPRLKYFDGNLCKGFARSFPTTPAIDRVAKSVDVLCYETPVGWKYFGNLLDANKIDLCGEESFGLGASHIREKDGMFAALSWLSVLAHTRKSLIQLARAHWNTYGRDYFNRLDFEGCDSKKAGNMFSRLETLFSEKTLVGQKYGMWQQYEVADTGNFEYIDPVDNTKSGGHGLYMKFKGQARIIFRLSGTGSEGATVRVYINDFSEESPFEDANIHLRELRAIAYKVSNLVEHLGRTDPTVET